MSTRGYRTKDIEIKSPIAMYYFNLGADYFMDNIMGYSSLGTFHDDLMSICTLSDEEKQEIWEIVVLLSDYRTVMFNDYRIFSLVREWDKRLYMFNRYVLKCRVNALYRSSIEDFGWKEFKKFYGKYKTFLEREEYVDMSGSVVTDRELPTDPKSEKLILMGRKSGGCTLGDVIKDLEESYPELLENRVLLDDNKSDILWVIVQISRNLSKKV